MQVSIKHRRHLHVPVTVDLHVQVSTIPLSCTGHAVKNNELILEYRLI